MNNEPWRPWNDGSQTFPIANPTTKVHKELLALWNEWHDRQQKVAALGQARRDAFDAAQIAHDALQDELARESESGEVGKSAELKATLESLIAAANDELWNNRISKAE